VDMSDTLRPYKDLFPEIGQRVMIDTSSVVIGDVRLADDVGIWMDKITSGPNWEEILGGEFEKRAKDQNFENMQKAMYGQFENT
ncbi:hypothetical protein ONJ87_27825, partial [Salmonella enterica subsp. enterica serovar Anatum]|nr:hypothetical protein [Salmonella enterica subsp. enterica serovar Anatum]